MNPERYARHALIEWFDQAAVASERLIVVGAGAVGNEVIKNLALLGVGEIHVFDLDGVEVHNLTRSVLFREGDIGRPKAECAAARAHELDPSVRVVAHHGDFWDTLDFSLLRSATGVFCCVDNIEARVRLNRLCALAAVPLVNTGIDSRLAVVEQFPFSRGREIACYECGLPPASYAAMARRYSCGWLRRVASEEGKIPTTILTSSAVASLAVSVHLRGLCGETPTGSRRLFMDTFTGQTTHTELSRNEGCPGCGDLRQPRVIVRARPEIQASGLGAFGNGLVVRCSDRVLTHVRCRGCEADQEPTVVFDRASRFDERFAVCPRCEQASRELGMVDEFELGALVGRFEGRRLPVKFVVCDLPSAQVVVELDGATSLAGSRGASWRADQSQPAMASPLPLSYEGAINVSTTEAVDAG
jgi:molybdopterin-synthase adenylyltransferase